MALKTCIVIGAAREGPETSLLSHYAELYGPDRATVYCADGGLKNAENLGICPDILLGDFDSLSPADVNRLSESGFYKEIETIKKLPPIKDETDLFACVLEGIASGYRKFILVYCTGGRLDHFMGVIAILDYLADHDAEGVIVDRQNEIRLIKKGVAKVLRDPAFPYISLIPLDKELTGVSMTGFKYPLTNALIRRDSGIGISNEISISEAVITIEAGRALLIRSRD